MRRSVGWLILPDLFLNCLFARSVSAQSPTANAIPLPSPVEMNLWPGNPPDMVPGAGPGADDGTGRYRNVGIPGMLVYLPMRGAGDPAIIVCPGGAYTHLTRLVGGDGTVAEFCPKGMAVIVLKYRLNPPSKNVEADSLADLKRAIRIVRSHSSDWRIDPDKIGVLGWSAGANLALNLATHFDRDNPSGDPFGAISCRPDFVVLLSPWPDGQTLDAYPIGKNMPPAFIGSAKDDKTAPPAFAQGIVDACRKSGVPEELMMVDTGGHDAFEPTSTGPGGKWPDKFWAWLDSMGMSI